jgi:diguanylate cyclase (GGDEF)-like protein/PAS domain S-box-containing protein
MAKKPGLLESKKYGLLGIGFGIFFWVLDSAVDAFIFHEDTFLGQLLAVDTMEAWMRLVIMSITTIFGFWAQGAIDIQRRTADALRKCVDQYQDLFDNNPLPMWVYDFETLRFLAVNDSLIRYYGYSREQFLSMTIKEICHPEDIQRLSGTIPKITQSLYFSGPWRILKKDGTVIFVEITSHSITFEGRHARLVLVNDITTRKQSDELIHHLAYNDLLTDLPNRLSLHDDIDRAITRAREYNRFFALIVINLDRFEEMNNTLGHNNGDLILQGVAVRLKGIFLPPHTVARLGGDEFAVLIPGADADTAKIGAGRTIDELKKPFPVADLLVEVSSSIGISLFPGHGMDAHTLIRRGEIAMYAAKRTESGHCVYSSEFDQYSPTRLARMGELRRAIEQDQLFLLYQPKIDLRTGKTVGVEALVRWQHPKSGVIPPNDFICLAERGGLIKELTLWVLKEALSKSRGWLKSGIEASVAINLSVKSLHNAHLLDQIKKNLLTCGITPGAVRFEITESIIMSDPKIAMEIITDLTSMGIRFSIDDFGTGYSSLGYLQRLPVDEIKIDKSFVINMMKDDNSLKIVRSIIELGHSLGLKVVAEGVEDKETYDRLALLGCDLAQGYYMSRPIPLSEFIERMRAEGVRKNYPAAVMS